MGEEKKGEKAETAELLPKEKISLGKEPKGKKEDAELIALPSGAKVRYNPVVGERTNQKNKVIALSVGLMVTFMIIAVLCQMKVIMDPGVPGPALSEDTQKKGMVYNQSSQKQELGVLFTIDGDAVNFMVIALLGFIGPYGFFVNSEQTRVKDLEAKLPDFLRDVAESGRFGMTLADSVLVASKGKYGKLTPEIRRMAAQIGWGVSTTEAFKLFGKRVNTPLVNRTTEIIIKASSAGGNVADVLTLVSNDTRETQMLEEERGVEMQTYIAVIYIAFGVFMVTILILNAVFIPQMEGVAKQSQAQADASGGGAQVQTNAGINTAQLGEIKLIYLGGALVHGVGDGIMIGVITNGKVANGMRHSFIMVLAALVALRLTL